MRRPRRSLALDLRIFLLALLAGLPGSIATLALLWTQDVSA